MEDSGNEKINGKLYNALIEEDDAEVLTLCKSLTDHALHMLTIHEDTVLHMATFSKGGDLSLKLLAQLPPHLHAKMTHQNKIGNTILHEVASRNHAIPSADKLLEIAPKLLELRNHNGETALFRAASYGNTEMFNFLAGKISYDQARQQKFLQREDKTTALHISILSQHYDLALQIAENYPYLAGEKDGDGMTSLQILSCSPSAFKHKIEDGVHMQLINSIKLCCSATRRKEVQKEKQRYESAMELAKFLIEIDTSWKLSNSNIVDRNKPKIHKYGVSSDASSCKKSGEGQSASPLGQKQKKAKKAQTPLILATKSGWVGFVEEMLKLYPQAIEYIDDDGQNILHLAIKYRKLEIFNLLTNREVRKRRLIPKIDNNGNTTLHMVCKKRKDYVPGKLRRPALVLQEELLWFERVKKVMPRHFLEHRNHMSQTADGLFAETYTGLYNSAIDWLKSTSQGCSVMAVLIATVTYAAAYTIPGGPNQSTGVPILISQPLFVVFTVANILSLIFALTALVSLLSILASSFRFEDFTHFLPERLMLSFKLLFLSSVMMMVAFTATFLLMISRKESWTKIMVYTLSFITVGIFVLALCLPFSGTCKNLFKKIRQAIPWSQHFRA